MGKVLVLTNNIGGLHSFRKEVIRAIIDAGYDVYISEPDDDDRKQYFENIGCQIVKTVFQRRGKNPFEDLRLMLRYRKLIHRVEPKAVLTYTIKPNIYGGMACRMCGVPQLANITGLGDAIENTGWLQKLTIWLYRLGVGKAKRVFFQNQSNRDFCINNGIADECSILLPGSGVNLNYHTLQPYPSDDGKVRFLFIGRLLRDKGIEEYFNAARYLKGKYLDTEFQILGNVEGPYQMELGELIKDKTIVYLGTTSDVRPYIGAIECTVMPSYHEGMSNVNLESAANGRPVITSNVPGCRETVDDGITGYLIEAQNSRSLIEAIERFILLPYEQKKQMGLNGREKVEKEFSREIVVQAYLNELESLDY